MHGDLTTESEYDYSYEYAEGDYSDDSNAGSVECTKDSQGPVFEELQRDIYTGLPHNVYCEIVDTLETQCFEQSLLEIWMYNEKLISNLTKQDIINDVNKYERSPYFGFKYNYSDLLGSVKRNRSGHIISASAAMYRLVTIADLSNIFHRSFFARSAGRQQPLDEKNIIWQNEATKVLIDQNVYSAKKGWCMGLPIAFFNMVHLF